MICSQISVPVVRPCRIWILQAFVKASWWRGENGPWKAGTRFVMGNFILFIYFLWPLKAMLLNRYCLLQRYFVLDKGILRYSRNQFDVSEPLFLFVLYSACLTVLNIPVYQTELKGEVKWINGCQSCSDVSKQKGQTYRLRYGRWSLSHQGKIFCAILKHLCKKAHDHGCFNVLSLILLKTKSHDLFYIWLTKLSAHRIYKRNEAAHVHNGFLQALSHGGNTVQRNGATQEVVSQFKTY